MKKKPEKENNLGTIPTPPPLAKNLREKKEKRLKKIETKVRREKEKI
jgi:hypothetical protein